MPKKQTLAEKLEKIFGVAPMTLRPHPKGVSTWFGFEETDEGHMVEAHYAVLEEARSAGGPTTKRARPFF